MWTSSSRSRENHGNDILSCLKTCLKIVREVQHQNSNWKWSRRKKMALEEVHGENFPASFLSMTEWQTSQIREMAGEVCIPKHDAQKHGGVMLWPRVVMNGELWSLLMWATFPELECGRGEGWSYLYKEQLGVQQWVYLTGRWCGQSWQHFNP